MYGQAWKNDFPKMIALVFSTFDLQSIVWSKHLSLLWITSLSYKVNGKNSMNISHFLYVHTFIGCKCLAMQNVRAYWHEDQVMQFLTGLNDQYSVVRTHFVLMEPLPPINKVYPIMLQEESNQKYVNTTWEDNSILVNPAERFDHKDKPKYFKNPLIQCTLRNKSGYTMVSVIKIMVTKISARINIKLMHPPIKFVILLN